MAAVKSKLKATGKLIAEPLLCVGLKAVLELPVEELVGWVKSRFADHSMALPKAITAANDRAWQAVALALAGDTLLGHIKSIFRDGDLKAVQAQIRAFVTDADTGLDGQPAGLRAKACDELNRLQRAGRLGSNDIQFESLDLTRFGSTAKVADDAVRAVQFIADDLRADAPHLSQVLLLTTPGGGTPLLAAAFAYFLRRQIAGNPALAAELTHDQLRLLTLKQQAGFANLETALGDKFDSLEATLGGWFATTDATLEAILVELKRFRDANQVQTKPESPLRVSVTNEDELEKMRDIRDRLRGLPPELLDAKLQSLLGDGLAAAAQFEDAAIALLAAADTAKEDGNTLAEAEAAYKRFKTLCEVKQWEDALTALDRAILLDPRRFRPVPRHYEILGILGAGAFGVVLTCLNKITFDDDGVPILCAVKVFRETDLDRSLNEVFAEAHALKSVSHPNVIRVLDHGFADAEGQQRPYLAMEYFEGATLEDWLASRGKLSEADFQAVFAQIAAGLHAAHSARRVVIHRDIKPSNIMLRKVGDQWEVKVIDFGLAVKSAVRNVSRAMSQNVPVAYRSTHDKSVTGTIKYSAPEQIGEKPYPVGPWSDVFAFGNTALEALFGTVKPGPKHWKQLPDELTELLARCVDEEYDAKNPADGRYHGFGPILVALAPVVTESKASPRPEIVAEPKPVSTPVSTARVEPGLVVGSVVERYRHFRDGEFHPGAGNQQGNKWKILKISEAGVLCELLEGKHAGQGPGSGARFDGSIAYRTKYPDARASQQFFDEHRLCGTPAEEVLDLTPEPQPSAKPSVAKRVVSEPAITADPVTEFAAWKAQVSEVVAQAERAADVFDYGRAVTLYAGVPAKRRDEGKLTEWTAKRDRLALVWAEVEGGWKEMDDEELATRLEEVVSLHQDHPKAKAWLAQLGTAAERRKAKLARMKAGDCHEITLPGGVKMLFAWCPPGTFQMGSPSSEKDRGEDETQHAVTLTKGFYMGVHPVTQAQYQAVMGSNPSHFKGETLPMVSLCLEAAVKFCGTLKQMTGVELRLPTEAEWEYACRAGTTTEYKSGDGEGALKAVGRFSGNAGGETHPVGQLKANAWGLHDMHGNVCEWCADWPQSGSSQANRGGMVALRRQELLHCLTARERKQFFRKLDLGFRLALVPSGQ